jgi:hypothetical protein
VNSDAKSAVKPFVYIAVGVAAIGGLLFGYDTGLSQGLSYSLKASFLFRPRWRKLS